MSLKDKMFGDQVEQSATPVDGGLCSVNSMATYNVAPQKREHLVVLK